MLRALLLALALPCPTLAAQGAVPATRTLKPATARLDADFSRIIAVRELSDGRILVTDAIEKRLTVADFATQVVTAISREGSGPGEFRAVDRLYDIGGDSTLMPDLGNGRWLILRADRVARTTAKDEPAVQASRTGFRGASRTGRVMMNTLPPVTGGTRVFGRSDSTALLLVSTRNGDIDTIGRLRMPPLRMESTVDARGNPTSLNILSFPFAVGEEPLIFGDGWVAVVRLDPYRVDWRSPDGRWTRGAALPFEVIAVNAREREAFVARRASATGNKPVTPPDDAWPETIPPFGTRPLLAAPDGAVLVLRNATADHPGNRYDLVDRRGRLVARIELPRTESIAALGARGAYVVVTDEDGLQHIERRPWP